MELAEKIKQAIRLLLSLTYKRMLRLRTVYVEDAAETFHKWNR
jgi:hypothetical protein